MAPSASTSLLLTLLLLLGIQQGALAQLVVKAITPSSRKAGKPNTFIGTTGGQIATSLLASNTPALLWGAVPSNHITKVCQAIVKTGSLSYTAKISGDWGGSETLKLKVVATGGCGAAKDSSGVQFVFTDNFNRKSAIVCPNNAGKSGCGVYMTGKDVDKLYHKAKSHVKGNAVSRILNARMLGDCQEEAGKGAIGGAITGVLAIGECLALGPLGIFCAAGVIGVSAELGALAGCASSCFPGEAQVQTSFGDFKPLAQLAIGDKVAVSKRENGEIIYDDVYAFGHKDPSVAHEFYKIKMVGPSMVTKSLELSALHFVPTSSNGVQAKVLYKRARDINVGELMWAASISNFSAVDTLSPFTVTEIARVLREGVYNPLTLRGTIIVNGVVASVHSDWFLDDIFDVLGLTHWLPNAYQIVLSPARLLYAVLGKDRYTVMYNWLDAHLDVAEFGTAYGGTAALASAFILLVATCTLFSLRSR